MSSKEDRVIAPPSSEGGPVIILSAGLAALTIGEAIFLLAALILPPTAVNNDTTFFLYGLLGMALVAIGALLVAGGLIGLKGAHWLIVLCVLLVAGFAAYGFHWPNWLLPPVNSPFRPFIGQFTLGGIMFVLFLVVLLSQEPRIWPALWRPLLVAALVAAIAIGLLIWLYSRIA